MCKSLINEFYQLINELTHKRINEFILTHSHIPFSPFNLSCITISLLQ